MSAEKKYREFWIANDRTDENPFHSLEAYNEHRDSIRRLYPGSEKLIGYTMEALHVIDYQAVLDLQSKLMEAKSDIEYLEERLKQANETNPESVDQCKKLQAMIHVLKDSQLRTYDGLTERVERYEKALNKIQDWYYKEANEHPCEVIARKALSGKL